MRQRVNALDAADLQNNRDMSSGAGWLSAMSRLTWRDERDLDRQFAHIAQADLLHDDLGFTMQLPKLDETEAARESPEEDVFRDAEIPNQV